MARKVITEADVKHTIEQLRREGVEPSTNAIYDVLKRGSFTTIKKYMDLILAAEPVNMAQIREMPENLLTLAEHFCSEAWRTASNHERELYEEERNSLAKKEEQLHSENWTYMRVADELRAEVESLMEQLSEMNTLASQFAMAEQSLAHLEKDYKKAIGQISELNEEAAEGQAIIQAQAKQLEEYAQQITRLETQATALKDKNIELTNDKKDLSQQLRSSTKMLEKLETTLDRLTTKGK